MTSDEKNEKQHLFDNPKNVSRLLWGFYIGCGILVILDFIVHRHIYTDIERIPAFYAIYGFIACVALVLMAKVLRKLVMRDENYYHDEEEETMTATEDDAHHVDH